MVAIALDLMTASWLPADAARTLRTRIHITAADLRPRLAETLPVAGALSVAVRSVRSEP